MALIMLGGCIVAALVSAWLVVFVPSPYEFVAALCGSGISVFLLVLSLCVDE